MDLGDPQAVKVLSPEILVLMERAEVMCMAEGNILRRVAASGAGAPGVGGRFALDECHDGNQGDPGRSSAREYAGTSRRGEEGKRRSGSRITA